MKHWKTINYVSKRLQHTWKQPTGYDTTMKVYNCIANTQVPLIVSNKNIVSWYTCGPTVYDEAHIGHASCYMRLDILQRILRKHFGLNIVSTMNITDIDDKIIMRSNVRKVPAQELSKEYEKLFWQDMDALKLRRPEKVLRVTENMGVIVDFIQKLIDDNVAYKTNDGSVYFDVKTYETTMENCNKYGKLQNISKEEHDKANTIKKNSEDFALWKAAKESEPKWDSPFGPGRPGWHIECSAMASSFFGNPIDIHAGGIDLRFPHHENEEAQSCAYHKCSQWVNYWLHVGHLHLPNAAKMSKSLKNTVSIQQLLETCPPDVFRMACLLTNYKNGIEFSAEHVKLAEAHVQTIKNFIHNIDDIVKHQQLNLNPTFLLEALAKTVDSVNANLRKDFDTSGCIKDIGNLISACNKAIHASSSAEAPLAHSGASSMTLLAIVNYVQHIMDVFGLDLWAQQEFSNVNNGEFNNVMDVLVNFRHQLRSLSLVRKDKEALALCDDVRQECKKLGITLKDQARISSWSK